MRATVAPKRTPTPATLTRSPLTGTVGVYGVELERASARLLEGRTQSGVTGKDPSLRPSVADNRPDDFAGVMGVGVALERIAGSVNCTSTAATGTRTSGCSGGHRGRGTGYRCTLQFTAHVSFCAGCIQAALHTFSSRSERRRSSA